MLKKQKRTKKKKFRRIQVVGSLVEFDVITSLVDDEGSSVNVILGRSGLLVECE